MIKITAEKFSVEKIIEKIKSSRAGAIVCFLGIVRNDKIRSMKIECYKKMAKKELRKLVQEAEKRFDIHKISIVHRIGKLKVSDNIALIAVASEHREQAFKACEWLIDELKKVVPIWKEETK
ncbi:MAG: molybdenum cofactor biosynthesis protein MoaE [Candidatus Thermoplasmatota archaeon]|nr:molybdenum cofactor biosynthesis protein MoaE [Candidatus Thermoplasmatota archaeon]